MRLIDADDLLMDNSWAFYDENGNRNDACIAVENAPTVYAVPVVRCKDCKKYIPCQKLPIGTSKWCDLFDRATCEMNYCAWGERKMIIDERHINSTTGESKSYTVTNNGNAYITTRNLYYEQLQELSDRDYVEVVRSKDGRGDR